jgi:hypothetical protein
VVEPPDHLGHHRHHVRVGVAEDRAHLPAREVEHASPGRVLDEGSVRPFGDERRERRAVPHQMSRRPLQIALVRHRQILARPAAATPTSPDLRRRATSRCPHFLDDVR